MKGGLVFQSEDLERIVKWSRELEGSPDPYNPDQTVEQVLGFTVVPVMDGRGGYSFLASAFVELQRSERSENGTQD